MFVKVRRPTHTPRPLLHANAPPTPATFPQHLMQLINTATSTQHILQLQPSPVSFVFLYARLLYVQPLDLLNS
ncbi:hypothetical protein E2C01_073398 [Portunus trituberculatus]|uniref:Uncharacterized protein n=1 Tax=Portunus trituberculatus TaxID=210409 RepID=A0A5B7IDU7_PORTR|nr:hypothetical protein [Portunus trituberculatus]